MTDKPLKDEPVIENIEINEKESPSEVDANEDVPTETTEIDAKQNDINEGFRKFFSNIGIKLTVKRGSSDIATDVPDETNKREPASPQDVDSTIKETKSEDAELNTDVNVAQEASDDTLTTGPTLTDATSEDVPEKAEEKTTETKEEVESEAVTTPPEGEDEGQKDATPEDEPRSTSPSGAEEEISPIKRFFTTGIFSGLRKKKKSFEGEITEKELVDMGKKEETTDQTVEDQKQASVEPAAEAEKKESEGQSTDESKSPSTATEPEEKDKVQASPLKRLLSGSGSKKVSKKQRRAKSIDAKVTDSGEHGSDQLLSSTESAENQKPESPAQASEEAPGEEDSAWASFKKLVTPKKRMKRPSLGQEESQIQAEEPKPSEGEQISDHSTEEGKKRKDSSVSWEAVLCGSGRRKSRKTSDSEDETPQIEDTKKDSASKNVAESPLESSNEHERAEGSHSEGEGGTWKSLKRLVTPKKKPKEEDESKENVQSDTEVTQEKSSISIKKMLPGRKKRKSAEKHDQMSSDEADRDVASGEEDDETPAVVPLSEFDMDETEVKIETQAEIESRKTDEANQEELDRMVEPIPPCESPQFEPTPVQVDETVEKQVSVKPEEPEEDLTESISKHQQLSDIPEEGIITETMATPASVTEEPARDDTLAEDLIEITSEAITAPEPASDITVADETEMVSAVSQLSSESSKTSGNTTPVPAEYDVVQTDTLLHQVVETMAESPKADPLYSEEVHSEQIVGSVSQQVLETFVKDEPTILEIHQKFDATSISTGLHTQEMDEVNEDAATPQTERIFEVNDSVPTEIAPEVPTEKIDTAETTVVTQPEDVQELESIDERPQLMECPSETHAAVSTDILPECEETSSPVEAQPVETLDSREEDTTAIAADEAEDAAIKQEGQEEDQVQTIESITDEQPEESQTTTLDSEEPSVQELENDIAVPPEVVTELKEETVETETEADLESKQETEDVGVSEKPEDTAETEPAATLDSEPSSVQLTEEEVKSEEEAVIDSQPDEAVTEAEQLPEVSDEPKSTDDLPVDAAIPEQVQEVSEAAEIPSLDTEEDRDQSLEKEVISEDVPEQEPVPDEQVEPVDDSQPEHVQEPEEKLPLEAATTQQAQEPEVLPSDVPHTVTETRAEEEALTEEPEEQKESEETPEPDSKDHIEGAPVVDSTVDETEAVSDEPESEVVTNDQKTESLPEDAQIEQEDGIPEVVDELPAVTAVHVSTLNEEASSVQVLGETVLSEETPAPGLDNAAVADEPKHEVNLGAIQVTEEQEKEGELQEPEARTVDSKHAVVAQVIVCNLKDVSVAIPDVMIENGSENTEPMIGTVANQLALREEVEAAAPIVKDDLTEATAEDGMVVMMHVPSVTFDDNHRIQVQVVDVGVKSATSVVDTVLQVGVTEDKEVIDVCQETVEKVDDLNATEETVEEIVSENSKVTILEVIQHVKESAPEAVSSEQEVVDGVTESESSGVEEKHKVAEGPEQVSEDLSADVPQSLDAVAHKDLEETVAEQEKVEVKSLPEKVQEQAQMAQVAQSQIATSGNAGLVVPQNTGIISSVGNVEPPSSLSLEFKLNIQFGQTKVPPSSPPMAQRYEPVKQPDVSEVGVQVAQAVEPMKPISPIQPTEPTIQSLEAAEQTEQTTVKPTNPAHVDAGQRPSELADAAVQATVITEPAANPASEERAVVMAQPVLLDVGIQAVEAVEPVEKIKSAKKVSSSVQATQTMQPVRSTEKRKVLVSQPAVSEARDQEPQAEEPVKAAEEEAEQDVWMDAEEGLFTQEEPEVVEPVEPVEPQAEVEPEEEEEEEEEVKEEEVEEEKEEEVEEEEVEEEVVEEIEQVVEEAAVQETPKTVTAGEVESESEDFAVALEDLEPAQVSVATVEWD